MKNTEKLDQQRPDATRGRIRERLLGRMGMHPSASAHIGLEIGKRCIRAAEGEWIGGRFRLRRVFESCLPASQDPDTARRQLLASVDREMGLAGRRVTVLLSGETLHAKVLTMNRVPRAEVADAVRLGLMRAFPEIADSDPLVDHDRIGEDVDTETPRTRVLGVCAPRAESVELTSALASAGIAAPSLSADFAALQNLVAAEESLGSERPVVVLDVGADVTILTIYRDGEFEERFVIKVGRRDLVEALDEAITLPDGRKYQLSAPDAASFLSRYSLHRNETMPGPHGVAVDTERIHALLRPLLERLIRDAAKWIRHYQVESMCASPQGLVLCGEGARILGLDEYLEKYLSLPVSTLNPRRCLDVEPEADAAAPGESLAVFTMAIGAAMDREPRFRLMPREVRFEAYARIARRWLRGVAALALALTLVFAFAARRYEGSISTRLHNAEADLVALETSLAMSDARRRLEVRRADLREDLQAVGSGDARGSLVLRDLAALLGEGIRLESLALDLGHGRARLSATGSARGARRDDSWNEIDALSERLDRSPQFRDPTIAVQDWESGRSETRFELSSDLAFAPYRPIEPREDESSQEEER